MGKRPDMKKRMGKGADLFFEDTSANTDKDMDTTTDIDTDMGMDKATDTNMDTITNTHTTTDTELSTVPSTVPSTEKDTILDKLLTPQEAYVRHTVYLNEDQSEFVKGTAASRGVKQSEIVRIAVDMLMEAMKE